MKIIQETVGYVLRYAGGITVAGSMYRALNDTMLPEEFIGGVIAGGIVYIMGDCIARRKIAKQHLELDRMRFEIEKKQVSLLERIAEGNDVRPDLSDGK